MIDAFSYGRHNARTKKHIATSLGVSTREVEHEVERLRKSGEAAICSDSLGYWRPLTSAEYEANVDSRRRRAINQMLTVRGERQALRAWKVRQAGRPVFGQLVRERAA